MLIYSRSMFCMPALSEAEMSRAAAVFDVVVAAVADGGHALIVRGWQGW